MSGGPLFRDFPLGHELRSRDLQRLAKRDLTEHPHDAERRRQWLHANGLDGNGHGQLIPEVDDKL